MKTKKQWYEQGFSRKKALENQVFCNTSFSEKTLLRWEKEYHKDYPYWGGGIWDGGSDDDSAAIECYTSYSSTGRRKNPLSLVINFYCDLSGANFNTDSLLEFLQFLLKFDDDCTHLHVESGGYGFLDFVENKNGYSNEYKKVFPDRIPCGWMLYVPTIVLPELLPEAARVVPVLNEEGKQKGTIIISTEDVFDGSKKEHIEKSNDIEIRLLDLGLLPLITEL